MGDTGDDFNALKRYNRERKDKYGAPCPTCTVKLPKAQPKILMPGQRCWCGYRDTRPQVPHTTITIEDTP